MVGGGGGARVSEFSFTKNPNLKNGKENFLGDGSVCVCVCVGGGGGWRNGARVNKFSFTKTPYKKNCVCECGGGMGLK